MFVVGQHLRDTSRLHDEKGRTVREASRLIWSLGIQRESRFKLLGRLGNDLNASIVLQASHHLHRLLAERLTKACVVIEKFG